MRFTDYYETLGVKPEATEAEIKSAYRRLARKYHPDVSKEADAEERFKGINEANEVLGDKEKRAHYDRLRAGGYRGGEEFRPPPGFGQAGDFEFDADAGSFSDFFESLFGRPRGGPGGHGGHAAGGGGRRGAVRARLEVDLATIFSGGTRRIDIEGRTLDVKIPAGVAEGKTIRLSGQGGGGRDLLLEIGYQRDPRFEVDGRDLVHRLAVTPWQAALGATLSVPTLGGSVSLRIPPDSDSGKRLRLRGRGLPGEPPGDQYVVLEVRAPRADSDEQRAAYRGLAAAFGETSAGD
jgi:curved DNA-binding protein